MTIANHLKPCEQGAAPSAPFGVLLVNLGSPDAPTTGAVRRYLREFLSDTRVVDLPRWLWLPILHGVILMVRPAKVAALYKKVWRKDAPLREITYAQAQALQQALQAQHEQLIPVAVGMTYGSPSLVHGLLQLRAAGVMRVLVLPLYPQFSCATTASVFDRVSRALGRCRHLPDLRMLRSYHAHPQYIVALAQSVREHWQANGRAQKLLISFHGIPQRFAEQGDPYALQCESTARQLAGALDLQQEDWQLVFQSRFGREPWLQPYLEPALTQLAQEKITTLDIICPGFSADCLETLEEIAIRSDEWFRHQGGAALRYIPALNDSPAHIQLMQALVQEQTVGW